MADLPPLVLRPRSFSLTRLWSLLPPGTSPGPAPPHGVPSRSGLRLPRREEGDAGPGPNGLSAVPSWTLTLTVGPWARSPSPSLLLLLCLKRPGDSPESQALSAFPKSKKYLKSNLIFWEFYVKTHLAAKSSLS